jgi:hypothetical protein
MIPREKTNMSETTPETPDASAVEALEQATTGIAARLQAAFTEFLAGASEADRLLLTALLEETSAIQDTDGPCHGLPLILPVAYARVAHNQ